MEVREQSHRLVRAVRKRVVRRVLQQVLAEPLRVQAVNHNRAAAHNFSFLFFFLLYIAGSSFSFIATNLTIHYHLVPFFFSYRKRMSMITRNKRTVLRK